MNDDRSIAAVVLVDPRGWLLLQERDEYAPADPDRWSLVGGGIEPGEDAATAAVRELEEETGVTGVGLTLVQRSHHYCPDCDARHDLSLFLGLTDLTDADVECHEGRRIVFVDPGTIHTLDWSHSLAHALPVVMDHPSYVERHGRREPRQFGCVVPVDGRGRLLLQERDEHAPIDPDRWGLCGGHLEPGEDPREGTARELEEETGLRLASEQLLPVADVRVFHPNYGSVDHVHVFTCRLDVPEADVECHEGRRIVFVEPADLRGLPQTMTVVRSVADFLDSPLYAELVAG